MRLLLRVEIRLLFQIPLINRVIMSGVVILVMMYHRDIMRLTVRVIRTLLYELGHFLSIFVLVVGLD